MKRIYFTLTLMFFLLLTGKYTSSQTPSSSKDTSDYPYWIQMMQDPGANYFATVSAFEKYWKNRTITKGCGWKVFKRWEYIMRGRISPDGTKPAPDKIFNAWQSFTNINRSSSGNWISLGPSTIPAPGPAGYEGLGRLNVVAFHPTDQNKIYVGSPSGGFWLSANNGSTWSTSTDNLPTIGVSAISVDYSNPNTILMGTGDRDHGDAPGMGVFKSIDGGYNWVVSNIGMGNVTVCKLVQHPGTSSIFLAATTGGIYRSINNGASWTQTVSGNFSDICLKPGNSNIVYAESYGNFYRSSDNGLSFIQVTSGLTSGQRGAIAVSAASPNCVYFLQSDNSSGFQGVCQSIDAGLNFTTRSTSPNILDWSCDGSGTGGQGWYDLAIAADPANANVVYVGGVNVWKSVDGGITWIINSHWYGGCSVPAAHADCHFLGFSPANGRLYAGNDGGIYYTANGGTNWTDCTVGMTIGQIYKLGQSLTNSQKTINGLQDNGTYMNLSTGWVATGGGDGMECAVDYINDAYTYHTIYYGSIFRKYNNEGEAQIAGDGVNGINEGGGWVTPFILSEPDPRKMFVGYKNVWKSNDVTAGTPVWSKISSGETDDCSVLEQSPANPDILYVVRWGNVQRSDNANAASPVWTACALPGGDTPSDLEAHPTDPNIVYATAGYNVYKSGNKGASWTLVPGALPGVPVNSIVYDKNSAEGLYIGTQTGVLFKNTDMPDWVVYSTGLPVVDVRELEIYYDAANPSNSRLMAATFGRGLWKSDLIETGPLNPSVFAATTASNVQVNLSWNRNPSSNNVMVVWSATGSFGVPVTGTTYAVGNTIPGGGTVLYSGSGTSFNHTGLSQGTTYNYRAWSYDGTHKYSYGISANATTFATPAAAFLASEFTPAISQTVTLNDMSVFGPTSWVWSFSPSTVTFVGGTNANSQNPLVQFTAIGQYSVTLTASNIYGSDAEAKTNYINVMPGSYCIPTYSTGTSAGDFITLVQLGTINNATGASTSPYYNCYKTMSTNLALGSVNTITLSPGTYSDGNNISVWIDYNQNGAFETTEKLGNIDIPPTPATGSITFTVPASASIGITRMRVREVWANGDFDACSNYDYGETEDYYVIILSADKNLNLTVFLEGLFNGATMNKAQNGAGNQFPGTVADQITVELHNSTSPYAIAGGPYTVNVNSDGTASLSIPNSLGSSYYIVLKHRNSIETWNGVPVSFAGATMSYNFSSAIGQAYGSNLKLVSGKYVIFGGDVNQDGIIDSGDMAPVDNLSSAAATGYLPEDINGDGLIDSADMANIDNNSSAAIGKVVP